MSAMGVALAHRGELMALPGVVGVGWGADRVIVYVKTEADAAVIPMALDGVPVQVVVAGEIKPLW